jgi:hypothetical protein
MPTPYHAFTRRFLSTHRIENVLAVVKALNEDLLMEELEAISFPRVVHPNDVTLAEAGLVPRAAILIEIKDQPDDVTYEFETVEEV